MAWPWPVLEDIVTGTETMDDVDLKRFKAILEQERTRVMKEYGHAMETGAEEFGSGAPDINDEASRTMSRRLILQIGDRNFDMLNEIDDAIDRMSEGEYGLCEECEEEIPRERLELVPCARYCVACKERIEKKPDQGAS